jgi:hypothetical protein
MQSSPVISTGQVSKPCARSRLKADGVSSISRLRCVYNQPWGLSVPDGKMFVKGVRQIKATDLNPVYLFVSPPSMTALRTRLQERGTETEASVQKRLATAIKEIEFAKEPNVHDIVISNDDLLRAYELFRKVALGEEIVGDVLPSLDD